MNLRTGDLVLFADQRASTRPLSDHGSALGWLGHIAQLGLGLEGLLSFGPRDAITHVAIVLVSPPIETVPRGTYLWETTDERANDPRDDRSVVGIRLARLAAVDVSSRRVYVRRCAATVDGATLRDVHRDVHLRPYDMCASQWLTHEVSRLSGTRSDPSGRSLACSSDRRWCSAFVAYVLTRLGWLSCADWRDVRPSDLSSTGAAAAPFGWCDIEPYGADVPVSTEEWVRMVARRVPTFDDHRACLAKGAASRLASRGVTVAREPIDMQAHFCVTVDREVRVSVPATEANRARFDAYEPLHYAITHGGQAIPCTEESLLETIQAIFRGP
jgi:hypothetical protein